MTFASKNPNPLIARGFLLTDWRRGRDSNPRYAINVYTLSRRATSTTHPPLRFDMRCTILERVKGIEPSSKAWEAFVLPLNYTRVCKLLILMRIYVKYLKKTGEIPHQNPPPATFQIIHKIPAILSLLGA